MNKKLRSQIFASVFVVTGVAGCYVAYSSDFLNFFYSKNNAEETIPKEEFVASNSKKNFPIWKGKKWDEKTTGSGKELIKFIDFEREAKDSDNDDSVTYSNKYLIITPTGISGDLSKIKDINKMKIDDFQYEKNFDIYKFNSNQDINNLKNAEISSLTKLGEEEIKNLQFNSYYVINLKKTGDGEWLLNDTFELFIDSEISINFSIIESLSNNSAETN